MTLTPADVFPEAEPAWARHPARRSVVHSTNGMVSCTQPLAARAGIKVLEQGGNAADAAVATAAALGLTEPMGTGIGGDLFCLFYEAKTKKVRALNGTGRSAGGVTLDQLRSKLGLREGEKGDLPYYGAESVTVPGAAAGWVDTVGLFGSGKVSMAQILAPAIELCEKGFPVGQLCSGLWHGQAADIKTASPNFAEILKADTSAPEGCRAPRPGELFRNPNLGKVFRQLADGGKKAFYEGETGHEIVKVVQSLGGHLTLEDLKHHAGLPPNETDVISLEFSGQNVESPVRLWQHQPNGAGLVSLIALGILQELEKSGKVKTFTPADHNSAEYLHVLIECLRMAFADGTWFISDHEHSDVPVDKLLSQSYLAERTASFTHEMRNHDLKRGAPHVHASNTVYFSVTDPEGNACSFVNSNFEEFGSRIVPRGCGFALQNRGAHFVLGPGDHPNLYAPRKRPFHTLTAPMLTDARDGSLHSCFGCMGKFMQPQGHLQLLMNMLVFGMNPQEALDAPRVCIEVLKETDKGTRSDTVFVEEGIPDEVIRGLEKLGHECKVLKGFARKMFGRGQIIRRSVDDDQVIWSAGSDQRGDGHASPL